MPKTTPKPAAAGMPAAETQFSIAYPPEILSLKAAREAVLSLEPFIADHAAFEEEKANELMLKLRKADLRDEKTAAELIALQSTVALCEPRRKALADVMEERLVTLRTATMRAKVVLHGAAKIVAEGKVQQEISEKRIGNFGKEAADENMKRTIRRFHEVIVFDVSKLVADGATIHAMETARQMLNLAERIYSDLPEYSTSAHAGATA